MHSIWYGGDISPIVIWSPQDPQNPEAGPGCRVADVVETHSPILNYKHDP